MDPFTSRMSSTTKKSAQNGPFSNVANLYANCHTLLREELLLRRCLHCSSWYPKQRSPRLLHDDQRIMVFNIISTTFKVSSIGIPSSTPALSLFKGFFKNYPRKCSQGASRVSSHGAPNTSIFGQQSALICPLSRSSSLVHPFKFTVH